MDEYTSAALELVKIKASQVSMEPEAITAMVKSIAQGLREADGAALLPEASMPPAIEPSKAVKENSVVCLECGKSFKVLTKKHLAAHGLTPEEYRAKWGYRKGQALCAKALVRERRKKMKDMALWLRRKKPAVEAQQ